MNEQYTIRELSDLLHMTTYSIQKLIVDRDIQPVRVHVNNDGSQTKYYTLEAFKNDS